MVQISDHDRLLGRFITPWLEAGVGPRGTVVIRCSAPATVNFKRLPHP